MGNLTTTRATVLALDLEGTLISNAMSQIPRPGLFVFLSDCHELFPRIVMFTTIREERFRAIAKLLVQEEMAPLWFNNIEYVPWHGQTKNLAFIPESKIDEVVLVDDFERYVHPGRECQWVPIEHFDHPYPDTDIGLSKAMQVLRQRASET